MEAEAAAAKAKAEADEAERAAEKAKAEAEEEALDGGRSAGADMADDVRDIEGGWDG